MVANIDVTPGSSSWLRLARMAKLLSSLTLVWLGIEGAIVHPFEAFRSRTAEDSFGSFPAVPAGQRRGRSTSISGPPPRVTRRPDDNALDLLS
jgi:hypothetical protein